MQNVNETGGLIWRVFKGATKVIKVHLSRSTGGTSRFESNYVNLVTFRIVAVGAWPA